MKFYRETFLETGNKVKIEVEVDFDDRMFNRPISNVKETIDKEVDSIDKEIEDKREKIENSILES